MGGDLDPVLGRWCIWIQYWVGGAFGSSTGWVEHLDLVLDGWCIWIQYWVGGLPPLHTFPIFFRPHHTLI